MHILKQFLNIKNQTRRLHNLFAYRKLSWWELGSMKHIELSGHLVFTKPSYDFYPREEAQRVQVHFVQFCFSQSSYSRKL